VDAWVSAPAAGSARSFLQFGEVGVTTSTAVITLGVDNANKVTVTMRDKNGATVVAAAAATLAALVVSVQAHIKFTWDAREGTASLTVDGAATPPGDFSVDPNGTPWDAGVPVEANLDRESWTGSIHLVQVGNV
jgi:hypothetical protein